jgi:uncharacterized protein YegP (UPF0339 family)
MKPRIEIHQDDFYDWHWRLLASNNYTLCRSFGGYARRRDAVRAARRAMAAFAKKPAIVYVETAA